MLVLQATVVIKPEARDSWPAILAALLPPSRAEDACLAYTVSESVESPNTFIFVEQWASLDGLHTHNRTPHVAAFFAALEDVLVGPPQGKIFMVSSTMTLDEVLAESRAQEG